MDAKLPESSSSKAVLNKSKSTLVAKDQNVDYNKFDLNKLTPEEVKAHKEKWMLNILKKTKKPGDSDFKYDVQEDFAPHLDNEWDMDEDII